MSLQTIMPTKTVKKIEAVLLGIEKQREEAEIEWIEEDEARKLIGRHGEMKKKTFLNYLYKGKIPRDCWTTSPINGKRLFDKQKLMGLKK